MIFFHHTGINYYFKKYSLLCEIVNQVVSVYRCHFDLLRKSDKLLRELKNLDNQKWYVYPKKKTM